MVVPSPSGRHSPTAALAQKSFLLESWANSPEGRTGIELSSLFKEAQIKKDKIQGSEKIFYAGFKEYARLHRTHNKNPEYVLEGTTRAMRISYSKEVDALENNLPFLATVGSISPYIGLFGTVWGIMHSFIALGSVKQATLSMVAPGC